LWELISAYSENRVNPLKSFYGRNDSDEAVVKRNSAATGVVLRH